METKQKTWEDCCNQIAKDNGWDNWESVLISKMSLESKSILTYKAAELFNSSIAEERDELKEKLKIAIDGISDLEKEYRKTEAELNSYSRIAHQLKEENERLKEEINLQLKDNAKSLEEFAVLKVQHNSLGVKFDKQIERWIERDQKQDSEITSLKEENERLKQGDIGELWRDYNSKIDFLKQLNSELLGVIDETVNHMDKYDTAIERHSLLYDKMKNMLSKASDGYTKAKD